jgi:hypothetical protein
MVKPLNRSIQIFILFNGKKGESPFILNDKTPAQKG